MTKQSTQSNASMRGRSQRSEACIEVVLKGIHRSIRCRLRGVLLEKFQLLLRLQYDASLLESFL